MSRKPLLRTEGSWFLTPSDWEPINQPHQCSYRASGCHVCAARVKHKSQQVSKDKRGNSGLYVNLASPKNISKVSVKVNAQIRIMFSNDSNDSFRIGNISTLYISDSRGDQSSSEGPMCFVPRRVQLKHRLVFWIHFLENCPIELQKR